MRARTAIAAVLGLWLAVGLALGSLPDAHEDDRFGLARPTILLASLTPFGACEELLAHVQAHALEQVGPYGLGGAWGVPVEATAGEESLDVAATGGGAALRAPAAAAAPAPGDAFSGTNVQEADVDEPDIVKTDGRILYSALGDGIRAFDVTGDVPVELGTLRLDGEAWGRELLLAGDRLLVLGTAHGAVHPGLQVPADARIGIMPAGSPAATLTLVDVSDPARMRTVETLTLDGAYLSARLVDGVARVVVRSEPTGLPFTAPEGGGIRAEEEALERNREVIRSSTVDQWLPFFVHTDAAGDRSEGTLLPCEQVHRPGEFSGLGTLGILSIDPARGLQPRDATAVLAGGETIAASTQRLYVATARWVEADAEGGPEPGDPDAAISRPAPPPGDRTTEIHAFDITAPAARYVGSGSVPGTLLNQFAMSEHAGHLRVATTEGTEVWGGGGSQSSRVGVLAERDGALVEVGAVTDLGIDERIYAVRFLGDVGYVVTFRETDPLYTLDLADPARPRVLGELKIPGYSAYLHPVGDGLVLGVGQDADEQGRRLGAQVSLFDVADLSNPQRLATAPLGGEGTETPVEHDHRAFLHWPRTGLVVVPFARWRWDEATQRDEIDNGAVVLTADRAGLGEIGRISHLDPPAAPPDARDPELAWGAAIVRSVVVGERLLTVSGHGVLVSDLATLAPRGFTAFGPLGGASR